MEIKIVYYEKEITLPLHEDLDLYDLMDEVKGLLAMLGFPCESIDEYFDDCPVPRRGWIFNYTMRLQKGTITPEEILCMENSRRKRPIKLNTVFRAVNAAGLSYKK